MRVGVVRFPGSNCDDDALHCVNSVMAPQGMRGEMLWHKDSSVGDVDAVLLPGGFSYGDYLRAGAMAAHSPIMKSVKEFAANGGPVLAICNGFQIACEAGLLPGALTRNNSQCFICDDVYVRVEGRPSPFTQAIPAGQVLRMSIAHAEGRYVHDDIEVLEKSAQIAFRYTTKDGEVTDAVNPNGSVGNVAGVVNEKGNVLGLMPHPERAVEDLLGHGGEGGRALFESALLAMSGKGGRVSGGAA